MNKFYIFKSNKMEYDRRMPKQKIWDWLEWYEMTKWARMRKRKERRRTEALGSRNNGKETKLTQPEKISERIQHSQEIEKPEYI